MTTTTMTPTITKVTTLRFLEIDGAPGPARYSRIVDVDVNGQDYRVAIDRAVERNRLPDGAEVPAPRTGLDLDLGRATGTIAYALCLPAASDHSELAFLSPPVIALPTNFAEPEDYLTDIAAPRCKYDRWASFVCDIDRVRGSKLAARIREVSADAIAEQGHVEMLIPFMLNLIDRKLGFAPWMIPAEAPAPDPNVVGVLTHGGVHPILKPNLMIDL